MKGSLPGPYPCLLVCSLAHVLICSLSSSRQAEAYDLVYRAARSRSPAYISPDMPCRLYFLLTNKNKIREGADVHLHVDLPQGVKPVGLCVHRQPHCADPAKFGKPREVLRDGEKFYRYDLDVPSCVFVDIFLYLSTTLAPGTTTRMHYWGSIPNKEGPERKVALQVINIHKVKHKPKRLLIGESWEGRGAFLAWPNFEKHYTDLGMNFIGLTDFQTPTGTLRDKKPVRDFVDRCTGAGIHVAGVFSPGRTMMHYCEATPAVLARNQEGQIFHLKKTSNKSICLSYRGLFFEKTFLEPLQNLAACGVSFAMYDYEMGYGSENQYVCYCDRCLKKYSGYFREKYRKLEYLDPREVIAAPEEHPEHLDAWRHFVTDQTADWFHRKREYFKAMCEKYGAKSSPRVMIGDYGSPGPWKQAERRAFYKPKCLERGLDFIQHIFYRPWDIKYTRDKAQTMHVGGWRGFAYPSKNQLPWTTPGWTGGAANTSPEKFRAMLMEILANGCHGMVFYDGCGFDGLDFSIVAEVVDMFAPVEDIIIDGEYLIAECDVEGEATEKEKPKAKGEEAKDAVAHGQRLGNEMVLIVSHYDGKEEVKVTVTLPVKKPSEVKDLRTEKKLATVTPENPKLTLTFNENRATVIHVK